MTLVAFMAVQAYVIYSFYKMLTTYLGESHEIVRRLRLKGETTKLMFPFCCFRWRNGSAFYWRTTIGVLQYVVIRTTLALLTLILAKVHVYGEV
jgi:hypothetical protein